MKRLKVSSLFFIFLMITSLAQAEKGSLLVIGGGAESNSTETTWNYAAYNWAVDQSVNRKVAILHYSSGSSWLEDFFVNHCGAVAANSYIVNAQNADNEELMETISGYDVFFFRGGNQWQYYSAYKNSAFQDLVIDKYNNGGVLCGTSAGLAILSGVVFSAESGTIYSDEAILNINHPRNALADDLFAFYPGLIFDSHFTDRGRLARLVGFMARYERDTGVSIAGIGVDERTALAIDGQDMATVYGMGTVSVIRKQSGSDFADTPEVAIDSLLISTHIQGKSFDLETFESYGYEEESPVDIQQEGFPGTLFLSGGDGHSTTNTEMLEAFVDEGNSSEAVLVLTTNHDAAADGFAATLSDHGAGQVDVFEATYANIDNEDLAASIEAAGKILFTGNNSYQLGLFLTHGTNGELLLDKIAHTATTIAFIGDNARFAAGVVVDNYLTTSGVSQANLLFSEGLALLQTAIIIPNTFHRAGNGVTNYWKSTHGALPYAMIEKNKMNGIWLHEDNYITIRPAGNQLVAEVSGSTPVMHLTRQHTGSGFVSQTYNGTSNETPQLLAALQNAWLSFVKPGDSFILASFSDATNIREPAEGSFRVYPNPARGFVYYESDVAPSSYSVFTVDGNYIKSGKLQNDSGQLMLPENAGSGHLMIHFYLPGNQRVTKKVIAI